MRSDMVEWPSLATALSRADRHARRSSDEAPKCKRCAERVARLAPAGAHGATPRTARRGSACLRSAIRRSGLARTRCPAGATAAASSVASGERTGSWAGHRVDAESPRHGANEKGGRCLTAPLWSTWLLPAVPGEDHRVELIPGADGSPLYQIGWDQSVYPTVLPPPTAPLTGNLVPYLTFTRCTISAARVPSNHRTSPV